MISRMSSRLEVETIALLLVLLVPNDRCGMTQVYYSAGVQEYLAVSEMNQLF